MTSISPPPIFRGVDNNGNALSGGKLFVYAAGTTTKINSFTDSTGATPNTNPVILNSRGEANVWLTTGTAYKFVLSPSTDSDPPTNAFWTEDNIVGVSTVAAAFGTISDALAGTSTTLYVNPLMVANAVQQGFNFAADTGAANAYVGTFIPSVQGRVSGETLLMRMANNSTSSSATFNSGLGVDSAKKATPIGLQAIMAGEVISGTILPFTWSATDNAWQVGHNGTIPAVSWSKPLAKSGSYTYTSADRNRTIFFSGLAADATLTLPAPANFDGHEFSFVNNDTTDVAPFGVIATPASGLLDGVASRKGYTGTKITFCCDGSNWFTKLGSWRYFSGNQTITSAGTLTLAHGLGVIPKRSWISLKCLTGELGYTAGDIVYMPYYDHNSTNIGTVVVPDATNLTTRFGSAGGVFAILNKTTGASAVATNGNWACRFYAED